MRVVATANAEKAVVVVAVAVMVAEVNALKVRKAKSVPHEKVALAGVKVAVRVALKYVLKAATNCVKAKPALLVLSVANAHHGKVDAMAVKKAARMDAMRAERTPCRSSMVKAKKFAMSVRLAAKADVNVVNVVKADVSVANAVIVVESAVAKPAKATPHLSISTALQPQ